MPTTKRISENPFDTFQTAPIIDFLRTANITISNKEATHIYDQYKNNNKALIFLDPPYLASCNSFYSNPDLNIYEKLFHNDVTKEKALILLCLENNWIIKILFNGKKNICYDKKYEVSKKKTEHILIFNK